MKFKSILLISIMATVAFLPGCGKKEEKIPETPIVEKPVEQEEIKEEEEENKIPEGMVKSYLTGEWIEEEIAAMRPYAVMIGNTVDALPQYGLSQADIIYEAPVEASYSRLMAIFQDVSNLEKIGSVRSCRHYYIDFAREFDAIYVHYGQSYLAEPTLARDDVHNISGLDGSVETIAFYRDKSRKAPHNAFASGEGLKAAVEKKGYRTQYSDTYQGHYLFAKDNEPVNLDNGLEALVVSPGYLVNKPWFVYNSEDGLYYRYEFKKDHIDGASNEQLAVKNIIVQYCSGRKVDDNGYLDIDTIPDSGKGEGKFITNGKVINITWKKTDENSPTRYYDENGNEIILNQGKTWVCIMRNNYKDRFQLYKTQEELLAARELE